MHDTDRGQAQQNEEMTRRMGVVAQALSAFEPGDVQEEWPGPWRSGARFSVPPADIPIPQLALWVLTQILGAPDLGRQEKLAWEVRFRFEGVRCALAHQKFGLYLYIEESDVAPMDRSVKIVRRLAIGTPVVS